jgi:hypothetical protein
MRMFFCGAIAAVLVAAVCAVLGIAGEGVTTTAYAAFVCGAVSQGIKQFKE